MENNCPPSPSNKKEYISDLGKILVKNHGKKQYYKPEDISKAHRQSKWHKQGYTSCWGMCIFSSHSDFDNYHYSTGEVCNYAEMKTEMLYGLSASSVANWTEVPNVEIDSSWLDLGALEEIFEGAATFFSEILEGLT